MSINLGIEKFRDLGIRNGECGMRNNKIKEQKQKIEDSEKEASGFSIDSYNNP